ncbi:TetR/AcrR family transcriptional regulator [Cellulomonas denverensis]|uniref:TetR/AcrR family transcriptional regulator n=1 Tax=Cellulomonas denverensis TaxID=264297 RepID=UPI0035F032C3
MARWEPGARERLQRAALDLFVERGYPDTTAAEIAERAGLAKSTFFRHFTDKREVLFDREQTLSRLVADAIAAAPADDDPMAAVAAGLRSADQLFGPERHDWARRRQRVIDAHPELRERELLKLSGLTEAIDAALRARGESADVAALCAAIGQLALDRTFLCWIADDPDGAGWAALADRELARVRSGLGSLAL